MLDCSLLDYSPSHPVIFAAPISITNFTLKKARDGKLDDFACSLPQGQSCSDEEAEPPQNTLQFDQNWCCGL